MQALQTAQTGGAKLGISGCHLPVAASPSGIHPVFVSTRQNVEKNTIKEATTPRSPNTGQQIKTEYSRSQHRNTQGVIEMRNNRQATLSARAQSEETERVGVCEWQTRQRLFFQMAFFHLAK